MKFASILFEHPEKKNRISSATLKDLNLSILVDAITSNYSSDIKPYFYNIVDELNICYRQEIMRDMENPDLMKAIKSFLANMALVREYLAVDSNATGYKLGWFLEAALLYCKLITKLSEVLNQQKISSSGLCAFREYLDNYTNSPKFKSFHKKGMTIQQALCGINYCVLIKDEKLNVRKYEGESDYSRDIETVFDKFRQSDAKNYLVDFPQRSGINHIEEKILEFVTKLFPEPFSLLKQFNDSYREFIDPKIDRFEHEIQFYVAYLEFISELRKEHLPFCYPDVSPHSRDESVNDGFDISLAYSLQHNCNKIVCNDFFLTGNERIIVVSGPNQGGKTTFARMFGQIHYLASIGCMVPARHAKLFLPDMIFTHFERTEQISNLRGKLQDDLIRIREILMNATSRSIFIFNEIFSSTTVADAMFLSKQIARKIIAGDNLCVWVSFIDELSRMDKKIVSMVSIVKENDPTERTFKIIRKKADGLAYALLIARKHRLSYEQIRKRIRGNTFCDSANRKTDEK